ncbi:zeatin O-xylosyltransferase-like [Solanum dulcamara]|uniref:zeatin O-xylosyltransferase-like n=1 Tax=Solanum dulcamara TaxID=45834 RepID=UPI0024868479|nr:zeatin O-xylosyltransferase-like [Solanum dulcamara]
MTSSLNPSQNNGIKEDVVVVMVPFLLQGHLNPLLHISRLISSYNLPIHYICYTDKIKQVKNRVHGWDPLTTSNIHFHEFPNPPSRGQYSSDKSEFESQKIVIPLLEESLMLREPVGAFLLEVSKNTRRVVVIYDSLMASVVQDVVSLPNAEAYCFNVVPAFMISSMYLEDELIRLHLPSFIGKFVVRFLLPRGFEFPNNLPSYKSSFIPEFMDFIIMQHVQNNFCSGNLYNTCKEIEGPYLDVLARFDRLLGRGTKQWAIDPLLPIVTINNDDDQNNMIHRHECLKWLDKQEPNSVLLVSFGTTTSLSTEQIKELAIGLEKSQQKFIWIVSDVLLKEGEQVQIPKGYEERVQGRGFVVKDWAPQLEILGHSATGGFLTHCGWNSILESVTMGIPLATWPMVFDQPRNAVLITNVLKIGIEVKDWERRDELITSTTIETTIRKLMASPEGNEVRKNMVELGKKVRQSNSVGGNSKKAMDSFIAHITRS